MEGSTVALEHVHRIVQKMVAGLQEQASNERKLLPVQ
jgi:hypothetical protein